MNRVVARAVLCALIAVALGAAVLSHTGTAFALGISGPQSFGDMFESSSGDSLTIGGLSIGGLPTGVLPPTAPYSGPPSTSAPAPDPVTATALSAADTSMAAASDTAGTPPPADPSSAPDPVAASQFPELESAAETRDQTETEATDDAESALDAVGFPNQYSLESAPQALSTDLSSFGSWLSSSLTPDPVLRTGKLMRYLGDRSAMIAGPDGRDAVLSSTLPLLGKTPSGTQAPIDTALQSIGASYQAVSTLAPLTLPASASGEAQMSDQGISVTPVGATGVTGTLTNGRLVFANAYGTSQDTDLIYTAQPTGLEVSWVLRSTAAPTTQSLQFSLPAGAHLQLFGTPSGGSQTVEIIGADGSVLGFVMPPSAVDAAGKTVPTFYALSGADTLAISIDEQARQYALPILVDPVISTYPSTMSTTWGKGYDVGWSSYFNLYGQSGYSYALGPKSCSASCNGAWGEWYLPSVPGAYIYEEYLTGLYNIVDDSEEGSGIFGPGQGYFPNGTWKDSDGSSGSGAAYRFQTAQELGISSDFCVGGQTTGANGSCPVPAHGAIKSNNDGVAATVELRGATSTTIPETAVYSATLYQSDDVAPTLSTPTHSGYTPGTWSKSFTDNVSLTGTVSTGLGVNSIAIGASTSPFSSPLTTANAPCSAQNPPTNSSLSPCPTSFTPTTPLTVNSSSLPEGSYSLYAQAMDAGGNLSTTQSWTVEIDRTPPVLTTNSIPSATNGTITIGGSVSDPPANGANASSGVASVVVTAQPASGGSPISVCTATVSSGNYSCTWNTTNIAEGSYALEVTATDNAGNTTTKSPGSVIVDRTAPAVAQAANGPIEDLKEAAAGSTTLDITANDAPSSSNSSAVTSGIKSVEIFVDGQDPNGEALYTAPACPQGGCGISAQTITIPLSSLSAGSHTATVVLTDNAGNTSTLMLPFTYIPNACSLTQLTAYERCSEGVTLPDDEQNSLLYWAAELGALPAQAAPTTDPDPGPVPTIPLGIVSTGDNAAEAPVDINQFYSSGTGWNGPDGTTGQIISIWAGESSSGVSQLATTTFDSTTDEPLALNTVSIPGATNSLSAIGSADGILILQDGAGNFWLIAPQVLNESLGPVSPGTTATELTSGVQALLSADGISESAQAVAQDLASLLGTGAGSSSQQVQGTTVTPLPLASDDSSPGTQIAQPGQTSEQTLSSNTKNGSSAEGCDGTPNSAPECGYYPGSCSSGPDVTAAARVDGE